MLFEVHHTVDLDMTDIEVLYSILYALCMGLCSDACIYILYIYIYICIYIYMLFAHMTEWKETNGEVCT